MLVCEAVQGNTGHSRTFIQLLSRAEVEEARRRREAFRHWSAVKEQATQLHAQAKAAGDAPPLSVHPDDIELSADGTVAIVGPIKPDDIADRAAYYPVYVAYAEWVERRWIRLGGRFNGGMLHARLDFYCEQNELPPRLRTGIENVTARLQRYRKMPGRALHTSLRQEAERDDLPVPPRDVRVPVLIPEVAFELAKANGITPKQPVKGWLVASAEARDMQANSVANGSVVEG